MTKYFLLLALTTPTAFSNDYDHTFSVNPFRILVNASVVSGSGSTFSATYSLIDQKYGKEHAVPILYAANDDGSFKLISAEYQWRKYTTSLSNGYNGFIAPFIRATNIKGLKRKTFELESTFKIGIGATIGWTYIENDRHFLTGNLQIGRYLTGENSNFVTPSVNFSDKNDRAFILGIELFKYGYIF